ncbi:DUF3895 domain-containing protein [Paenibacillus mesophilus]|uniref:DUF3895 domain-containing protein n=1 Tax=Paenibacillus mesophilus TaxID=2582849 RepID=UPI0013051602|nr:DUF3895 domain-containing protein [Paenibacillus mesophilus]
MKLSEEQRDRLLSQLNEDQVHFLKEELKRGKRTVFANVIAKQKGLQIPEIATFEDVERMVDSWILVGYVDAGYVSPDLKCECGRSLRFQYHVINKQTGEEYKFGIDHLELHTGIDAKTVAEIRSGFSKIDLELDELLVKLDAGWSIQVESLPPFEHLALPHDIQRHFELQLPLLDRQVSRIRRLLAEYARERRQALIDSQAKPVDSSPIKPVIEQDLFTLLEPDPDPVPVSGGDELTDEKKQAILSYLDEGVQSARIIAELLIKHGKTRDSRFITGSPKIFVDVCWFIESFIPTKQCKLISVEHLDRLYQWNSNR